MVNVTHDGYYWWTSGLLTTRFFSRNQQVVFCLCIRNQNRVMTQFFNYKNCCILINGLILGHKFTHLHQGLNDFTNLNRHFLCKIGNDDLLTNLYIINLFLNRLFKTMFV